MEVLVGILRPGRHFSHQQLACSALANVVFHANAAVERRQEEQQQREEAHELAHE